MGSLWEVYGKFMGSLWEVYGKFMLVFVLILLDKDISISHWTCR